METIRYEVTLVVHVVDSLTVEYGTPVERDHSQYLASFEDASRWAMSRARQGDVITIYALCLTDASIAPMWHKVITQLVWGSEGMTVLVPMSDAR
jgi:hypothetical protein